MLNTISDGKESIEERNRDVRLVLWTLTEHPPLYLVSWLTTPQKRVDRLESHNIREAVMRKVEMGVSKCRCSPIGEIGVKEIARIL